METNLSFIEPLLEKVEKYGKTNLELFKLKAIKKSASVMSEFILRAIILFILVLFLLFATIGAALWLGEVLGKVYYGFFCVSGFYFIVGVILITILGKKIKKRIADMIINKSLN